MPTRRSVSSQPESVVEEPPRLVLAEPEPNGPPEPVPNPPPNVPQEQWDVHLQVEAILAEHNNEESKVPVNHVYWSLVNQLRSMIKGG